MVSVFIFGLVEAGSALRIDPTGQAVDPNEFGPFLLLATFLAILLPCLVGLLLLLMLGRRLRRRVGQQPVESSAPDPFWNLQSPPTDNDNGHEGDREGDGG